MDLKGHERPKKDLEGLDRTIMVRLVNSSLRKGLLDLNGHGRILELKRFYQKVQSTQHRQVGVMVACSCCPGMEMVTVTRPDTAPPCLSE